MGYHLRDRSIVKRKLSLESEPEYEVKTPAPKRRKTKSASKKKTEVTPTDEQLPKSTTVIKKPKASAKRKTQSSSVQVQVQHKVRQRNRVDRISSLHADAISIRSSSPILESQSISEGGPIERVLNTAELLETILLNVYDGGDSVISSTAMTTVLLSQRVNEFFKATIAGSVKLERALWLLPDEELSNSFAGTMQIRLNPLLRASLRHNRRPFAEASVCQHSAGAFLKIMCTVQGFFGDGCESSKDLILARTAREEYSCEITFRFQGEPIPLHPDFQLRLPRDCTVGDLENAVFSVMTERVGGTGSHIFKTSLEHLRWAPALESAEKLRAVRDKSATKQ
ncbi:hypothetical protein DOTSEDRAFT_53958 [Dothistroma septosporum NZE10]|uniref:Uncharacterized protein n=1 Tax=Dothistroma septosporum (strain NZE10 / CBS 128990) TaxID=675120 RepID=M2XKK6_DOTSN|nr:hypothetical protein DOTSEDRAFT_53958 [Dothistroma septosporum NZE10]